MGNEHPSFFKLNKIKYNNNVFKNINIIKV